MHVSIIEYTVTINSTNYLLVFINIVCTATCFVQSSIIFSTWHKLKFQLCIMLCNIHFTSVLFSNLWFCIFLYCVYCFSFCPFAISVQVYRPLPPGRNPTAVNKYQKQVKWSRYRPGVAQRVGRGIALLFHVRGTRRGEWSAARPGRTLPSGKTRYPFYRRLGGPEGRSGRAENLVPTGIRSRTLQPIVSRYTDWATRPTK